MTDKVQFVGGDDLVEPFQITGADGAPVDLTGATLSGRVWSRFNPFSINLAPGNGIEIANVLPTGSNPHGFLVLTEEQTGNMPFGAVSHFRVSVMDSHGVVTSTVLVTLERVA